MRLRSIFFAAAIASASVGAANASVVQFTGYPATSWLDGTFSTGLSGHYPDGFFNGSYGVTGAYNGYGQNGESISFNAPVVLNSLTLGNCNFCGFGATSYTVSLYNAASVFLTSQTIAASSTLSLLTFNTGNVSKATFTFTGGGNVYNDGRTTAWYNVNDVTYGNAVSAGAVPEPAAWTLMIGGFGLVGAASRRRRVALAA